MVYDLIIEKGFIIDGSGNPGFYGDVAIKNGKIKLVESRITANAKRRITAQNLLITPGFIDPHVHEELAILTGSDMTDYLKQGVTTIISGNCGHSVHPGPAKDVYEYMERNGLLSDSGREKLEYKEGWDNLSEYFQLVQKEKLPINFGVLLGHGTIRWLVMGGLKKREPNQDELQEMQKLVKEGMQQGAMGISTGLSYLPGRLAETEELIEMAVIKAPLR